MTNSTQHLQQTGHINNGNSSKFLIIDSDDIEQVENLSVMFPKLTGLIKNNGNKNFVINFKDGERSLIVMIVSKNRIPMAS